MAYPAREKYIPRVGDNVEFSRGQGKNPALFFTGVVREVDGFDVLVDPEDGGDQRWLKSSVLAYIPTPEVIAAGMEQFRPCHLPTDGGQHVVESYWIKEDADQD